MDLKNILEVMRVEVFLGYFISVVVFKWKGEVGGIDIVGLIWFWVFMSMK